MIAGACLTIVSSSIQLYNIVKEFAYDPRNPFLRDRLIKCCDVITQATIPLSTALDTSIPATDPTAATASSRDSETNDDVSKSNVNQKVQVSERQPTGSDLVTQRFSSVDAVEKL